MASKKSLKELLEHSETDENEIEGEDTMDGVMEQSENGAETNEIAPESGDSGLCTDCGDQPLQLECLDCGEGFCEVCFGYLHRTGKRKSHKTQQLQIENGSKTSNPGDTVSSPEISTPEHSLQQEIEPSDSGDDENSTAIDKFKVITKFIPMRLTFEERKLLHLLEAALYVSEYTDKVDIYTYSSKAKRIVAQLREMCTVLTGLVVANGLDAGKELMDGKDFPAHAEWFQAIFEIGRRYKIMNPEKMRSTYGKLAYMIMDSRLPEIKQVMEFDFYRPVRTVWDVLSECNALELLDDPKILVATREISADGKGRHQIRSEIKAKEQAILSLSRKYGKKNQELVEQALHSIGDYHAYLGFNRQPVKNMIEKLLSQFDPVQFDKSFSLGISSGLSGSRLSHNHQKQYQYVLQSLTLWSEIMKDMYMLWKLADEDLAADTIRYNLVDTGQGLNRVKPCPKVGRVMHNIIARAQKLTGTWVGSSVVHLGDRAVPNALFFLDKYLQVPRILNPVNNAIKLLPDTTADPYTKSWIEAQYGSLQILEKTILVDFFRHAFDGSGADNFYDAGSCIDGRLTSAWNWANSLPKKPYYKHFLITGFVGFDGSEGF